MTNGIEYYCVEVTSKEGIQYGIQIFEEEAIALYNTTMKIIQVLRTRPRMKFLCLCTK
jgi:hypothetical protein